MNNRLSLNKTQLQIIAIVAMVIDHIAWAFLDFWTPAAQVLHVIGRLTIPIMCFFIAEGYRKTHNLRRYTDRLVTFALISILPFYMFFHEEYGFRQNIMFDHLLSLLMLMVLEHKRLNKWLKVLLVILIFAVSMTIAGWPITPQLFTLAFYYGKTFKDKVKWFVIADLSTVIFIAAFAVLNGIYHFAPYDWTWYNRFYLLGFLLALPIIKLYNGQKGGTRYGRFFFYIFYPIHLLVLAFIKYLASGNVSKHDIYLGFHVICLAIIFIMLAGVIRIGTNKLQATFVLFLVFESVYILGFIIEQLASRIETFYMTAAVEYFGELLMLVAILAFSSQSGRIRFPFFVYIAHVMVALALVYSIIGSQTTGFFYSRVGVIAYDGYCKGVYVHSTGYYLSVIYIIIVIAELLLILINSLLHGSELEKRRVGLIFLASMFIWIPYAITLSGITGGYEVPGVGIAGAAIVITICLRKYGMFNSITLACENALEKAGEGVIILDDRLIVTYINSIAEKLLKNDSLMGIYAKRDSGLRDILEGRLTEIVRKERLYEVKVEELWHGSYIQGYTIWLLDATIHKEQLDEAENMAFHDALTGLYNRRQFEKLVEQEIEDKRPGTLVISDMDNFKSVNDNYGHRRGDQVLTDYADILMEYPEEQMYPCRIGGDEFMFYLRGMTDVSEIEKLIKQIMDKFATKFRDNKVRCTLSLGVVINDNPDKQMDFAAMYRAADKKLYAAKEAGKDKYVI